MQMQQRSSSVPLLSPLFKDLAHPCTHTYMHAHMHTYRFEDLAQVEVVDHCGCGVVLLYEDCREKQYLNEYDVILNACMSMYVLLKEECRGSSIWMALSLYVFLQTCMHVCIYEQHLNGHQPPTQARDVPHLEARGEDRVAQ